MSLFGGVDEAGRGPLAGPVVAAVVVLGEGQQLAGVRDSKKLSAIRRAELAELIRGEAVGWALGEASVAEIDELNIYWAKFLAARRVIESLSMKPDYIIVDGNKEIPEIDTPQTAIVKGDTKSVSIAAASILAKVKRDQHIVYLSDFVHEDYGWKSNKSYYCKKQIEAIKKHGKTKWHREKYVRKYLMDIK